MPVRMAPYPAVLGCVVTATIMPAALDARWASADAIAGLCAINLQHAPTQRRRYPATRKWRNIYLENGKSF